jgi:hypothetical protein
LDSRQALTSKLGSGARFNKIVSSQGEFVLSSTGCD